MNRNIQICIAASIFYVINTIGCTNSPQCPSESMSNKVTKQPTASSIIPLNAAPVAKKEWARLSNIFEQCMSKLYPGCLWVDPLIEGSIERSYVQDEYFFYIRSYMAFTPAGGGHDIIVRVDKRNGETVCIKHEFGR